MRQVKGYYRIISDEGQESMTADEVILNTNRDIVDTGILDQYGNKIIIEYVKEITLGFDLGVQTKL